MLKKWKIKANETKLVYVIFNILYKETYSPVTLNNIRIPQAEDAKYLELYLDRRLNQEKHIFIKRKQLGFQLKRMYWLFSSKPQLSAKNCYYIKQFSNLLSL